MTLPYPSSTIATGCNYATSDGPGGAGSRFVAPTEDHTTTIANRPHWALVLNDEYLDGVLEGDLAYNEVAALATFSGNSIVIDPSGGAAGDINYTGSLYMGEATWSGQEFYDTLFQILDENYNEVVVGDTEAAVTGTTGNAIGDGFVSTATTLNLNVTLPSGNYRLGYPRGTSLDSLPAYALIRADIRGLQEASIESALKSVYVCAVNSTLGPADYVGATAITDALTDLSGGHCTLYVRPGTYTFSASLTISADNVKIIGESSDVNGNGAEFDFSGGAYNMTVSGADGRLENILATFNSSGGQGLILSGDGMTVEGCNIDDGSVSLSANNQTLKHVTVTAATGSDSMISLSDLSGAVFEHCTAAADTGLALVMDTNITATFRHCVFTSKAKVVDSDDIGIAKIRFEDCTFQNDNTSSYATQFAELYTNAVPVNDYGIWLENCQFIITKCTRNGAGTVDPYVEFRGVSGRNVFISATDTGTNAYYADDYLLQAEWGCIENLRISLAAAAPPTDTAATNGAIFISDGATLRDVDIQTEMSGTWPMPLFWIGGGAGEHERAMLDGLKFSATTPWSGNDWANTTAGSALLVTLENFSTLKRVYWNEVPSSSAATTPALISINDNSNPVSGVHILDNQILMTESSFARVADMIYIYCDSPIDPDFPDSFIRIEGNVFALKPNITYTNFILFVKGVNVLTSDTSETEGCKYGVVANNVFHWNADTADDAGTPERPTKGPMYFEEYVYMWRLYGNQITANAPSTPSAGDLRFVWFEEENASSILNTVDGGGNMPTNNILRNNGVHSLLPRVASPDGDNDAGFGDGSSNLCNILIDG